MNSEWLEIFKTQLGVNIIPGTLVTASCRFDDKNNPIQVVAPLDLSNSVACFTLLHELGHAAAGISQNEAAAYREYFWGGNAKSITAMIRAETRAWVWALNRAMEISLPINSQVKLFEQNTGFSSYIRVATCKSQIPQTKGFQRVCDTFEVDWLNTINTPLIPYEEFPTKLKIAIEGIY